MHVEVTGRHGGVRLRDRTAGTPAPVRSRRRRAGGQAQGPVRPCPVAAVERGKESVGVEAREHEAEDEVDGVVPRVDEAELDACGEGGDGGGLDRDADEALDDGLGEVEAARGAIEDDAERGRDHDIAEHGAAEPDAGDDLADVAEAVDLCDFPAGSKGETTLDEGAEADESRDVPDLGELVDAPGEVAVDDHRGDADRDGDGDPGPADVVEDAGVAPVLDDDVPAVEGDENHGDDVDEESAKDDTLDVQRVLFEREGVDVYMTRVKLGSSIQKGAVLTNLDAEHAECTPVEAVSNKLEEL